MQKKHEKREGFIACVDTVSSKDNCIKYQVQMFDYDDPQEGKTICIHVISAQLEVYRGRSRKVTPNTVSFCGDLVYETDFPASERKTARQCFKELCNEFDPDKNPDLDEPNLDDSIQRK